jgi:hypothetical protein
MVDFGNLFNPALSLVPGVPSKSVRNLYPAPKYSSTDWNPEPVNEYLVPNAMVNSYGYIFKNFKLLKEIVQPRHRGDVGVKNTLAAYLLKKKRKTSQSAISILSGWQRNYYHFTLECLPKLYVLREHIENSTIIFSKDASRFQLEWIKILGLKNVTFLDHSEILLTPLAISSEFTSRDLFHHHIIIPEFRKWIISKIKNPEEFSYKRIFVGRKNQGHRKVLNLPDVKSVLKEYSFEYLEMEDFSVEQQVKLFMSADLILAVHGAALTNLCFANPGTKVFDLVHEEFNQPCFAMLSEILNLQYETIPCSGDVNDNRAPGYKDVIIDIADLSELLDSLATTSKRNLDSRKDVLNEYFRNLKAV